MNKKKLLNRKERAYIIQKISRIEAYKETLGKLTKKEEERLVSSIIKKIQAPQDLEER